MRTLARHLYTLLLLLGLPWINKRLAQESINQLSARQRQGHVSPFAQPVIWAHCASVGEVLAAEPLLLALQAAHPDKKLVVTTMTVTGAEQVRARLPLAVHYLLPLDLPWNTNRFINNLKPLIGIIFETEIWPNLIYSCYQAGIPLIITNGRMSAKAAANYQKVKPLIAGALSTLSGLAAKSSADAERFIRLGMNSEKTSITGSIKYDSELPQDFQQRLAALEQELNLGTRPVWIAASTHAGEDLPLLEAHQQLLQEYPASLLILAPRHPQKRTAELVKLLQEQGLEFVQRSAQQAVTASTQVYLLDTLGELQVFYALADISFVAGSLEPIGGHNLLEPAAVGTPVITGPYLHNFTDIAEPLLACGGLVQVQTAKELPELLPALWQDRSRRTAMQQSAYKVLQANRGALTKQLQLIEETLAKQVLKQTNKKL